ncbi:MAG TPA: hypothetical protein VKR31_06255 [Rhizomicrobium sp.]|nr:hypothetical protein [Rhizomicrobium sp.]
MIRPNWIAQTPLSFDKLRMRAKKEPHAAEERWLELEMQREQLGVVLERHRVSMIRPNWIARTPSSFDKLRMKAKKEPHPEPVEG